jgi:hypothetical protein
MWGCDLCWIARGITTSIFAGFCAQVDASMLFGFGIRTDQLRIREKEQTKVEPSPSRIGPLGALLRLNYDAQSTRKVGDGEPSRIIQGHPKNPCHVGLEPSRKKWNLMHCTSKCLGAPARTIPQTSHRSDGSTAPIQVTEPKLRHEWSSRYSVKGSRPAMRSLESMPKEIVRLEKIVQCTK